MAPTTGAWTSEDPVWNEGRYGYVSGAPSALTDETGRASAVETATLSTALACGVGGAGLAMFGRELGAGPWAGVGAAAGCGLSGNFVNAGGGFFIVLSLQLMYANGPDLDATNGGPPPGYPGAYPGGGPNPPDEGWRPI